MRNPFCFQAVHFGAGTVRNLRPIPHQAQLYEHTLRVGIPEFFPGVVESAPGFTKSLQSWLMLLRLPLL